MAKREVVTWVCDVCAVELVPEEVEQHIIAVDGVAVAVDLCGACWGTLTDVWTPVMDAGRRAKPRRRRRALVS